MGPFIIPFRQSLFRKIAIGLFVSAFLANFFHHMAVADKLWFVDLRNRVVGARLMDKGIPPYFFKWNPSYPEELYDPIDNRCNIKNNMITSPPSVLMLLEPLGRLSYMHICRIWIVIHYIFFLFIFVACYAYFKNSTARTALGIAGTCLVLSGQWVNSITSGQTHFFFPAFIAVMILLSGIRWQFRFLAIGSLMALLVWLRPNAIVLFPFALLSSQINRKQLAAGFVGGGVVFAGITLLLHQVPLWLDFLASCREWAHYYSTDFKFKYCKAYKSVIEGKRSNVVYVFHADMEVMTPRSLIKRITGININYSLLLWFAILSYMGALLVSFRKQISLLPEALLTGVLLYWVFELAAPIPKTTYYYVELFIVVLYLAGKFTQLHKPEKVLLIFSMLFIFLDFVPINMLIAELFTMSSLAVYLVRSRFNTPPDLLVVAHPEVS